jgi:hypothetical protein
MSREDGMQRQSAIITAVGTMFFGTGEANEFSVNRFNPEFYTETGPQFIFEGDGDQVIQVSRWGEAGMRAILYSKSSGRVGTLELSRNNLIAAPDDANLVNQLSGNYVGSEHTFAILAQPDVSQGANNFFPLVVRGYAINKNKPAQKVVVSDVNYDVYSGQFGLLLEDGRLVVGVEADQGFELTWTERSSFGEAMVQSLPTTFHFNKDTVPGKTAANVIEILKNNNPKGGL